MGGPVLREWICALAARLPQLKLELDQPLAPYTSFRIGGPALALAFPNLLLTPIDSTGKKAAFVERAAQLLGLGNVRVVTGRSCELNRKGEFKSRFDVVTARAVAPAPVIWKDAGNFTNRHGRFILYKTPEQAAEDLPALERLSAGRTIRWRTTEPFELPEEFGTRHFLYSLPR